VLAKLDALLGDRRAVPMTTPLGISPEEKEKPRRVCDEAYLAMGSMIYLEENLHDQLASRDVFLSKPEAARDAMLQHERRSAA